MQRRERWPLSWTTAQNPQTSGAFQPHLGLSLVLCCEQIEHMPTLRKYLLALARLALLLPVVLCGWAWEGQTAENAQTATDVQLLVAPEVLKAKIEETAKAPGLEESAKNALLEYYRKSLDNLATAAANDGLAKKFVQSIETTPAEISC